MAATDSSANESNIAQLWIKALIPAVRSLLDCHVCEKTKELILINDACIYETVGKKWFSCQFLG